MGSSLSTYLLYKMISHIFLSFFFLLTYLLKGLKIDFLRRVFTFLFPKKKIKGCKYFGHYDQLGAILSF